MHILALNTYHGGSHRAFIDHWRAHSQHDWTLLHLPARHWKWRMRHAAVHFAEALRQYRADAFDMLWCTDMLNLAEFIGLAPSWVQALPRIIYFHENQLGYPDAHATDKDLHYAFSNFTSALAADEVWFNSRWHLESFCETTKHWLARMPDFQPLAAMERIKSRALVQYPGIVQPQRSPAHRRPPKVLTLLWAARWTDDKNPGVLFDALRQLKHRQIDFRLNLLGDRPIRPPALFTEARSEFADHIDHWGYVEHEHDYLAVLSGCDVVISTAVHEFFGIAILEAVACGCIPLVPERLAYPETLALFKQHHPECFYDGSVTALVDQLIQINKNLNADECATKYGPHAEATVKKLYWPERARHLDEQLLKLLHRKQAENE